MMMFDNMKTAISLSCDADFMTNLCAINDAKTIERWISPSIRQVMIYAEKEGLLPGNKKSAPAATDADHTKRCRNNL